MDSGVTNVPIPTDLAQELEQQAKRFGMSLATYIAFIARANLRQHDADFVRAARFVFSRYPATLRKLAE